MLLSNLSKAMAVLAKYLDDKTGCVFYDNGMVVKVDPKAMSEEDVGAMSECGFHAERKMGVFTLKDPQWMLNGDI